MFENYKASQQDLDAIDEGFSFVWKPEMNFIFKDKNKIENTLVISYDSENIYLWYKKLISELGKSKKSPESGFFRYQIPHCVKINDKEQKGWAANLKIEEFEKLLPKSLQEKSRFELPIISGPLLTPFIKTHQELKKSRKRPLDPYDTRESYLATIVHEFAHVYYNQHKLWWFSDKNFNLKLLNAAKALYKSEQRAPTAPLAITQSAYVGEVFAFCADYTASAIFWPNHKKDIAREAILNIEGFLEKERDKNLDREDSALEDSHNLAVVLGKLLLETYPKTWPQRILARNKI